MCPGGAIENRGPVASPLEVPTFSEEEPGAPKEVIDAPYQRSSAAGWPRSQPARDQHQRRHQSDQRAQLPGTRQARAGLSWPSPEQLDAGAVEARLFKRTDAGVRSDRPEPDWLDVHREHKRGKHVTLQLLHFEYKQTHPEGWGYTQFCRHYKQWLGRQDVVIRLESAAGGPHVC